MSRHRLVLASASPRRRSLLHDAGFEPEVLESDLDDAHLTRGRVSAEAFVVALSWFKARRVLWRHAPSEAVIVAADTVCVHENELLGKPRDGAHAGAMLRAMRARAHRVVTGVTILSIEGERHLFVDVARVSVGALADDAIDAYVASGEWRGKAGAYNFSERVAAGWPVRCDGDATGVMGLPMRRVVPMLERLAVVRSGARRENGAAR